MLYSSPLIVKPEEKLEPDWIRTIDGCCMLYTITSPTKPIPTMVDAASFLDLLVIVSLGIGFFQPIPLTADILSRTDFLPDDEKHWRLFDRKNNTLAEITFRRNGYSLKIGKHKGIPRNLKYFHELQYYMRKNIFSNDVSWFRKSKVFPNWFKYEINFRSVFSYDLNNVV